jgi:glycogen debranching enzyme
MRRLFSAALLVVAVNARAGELPALRVPAEPHKFIDSVGHRALLMGREDGTFEAWIMPVKVLRDFRISVYFDGSLEPVPLADLAERVTVSPGHVTITHAHAAFTIRQTWVASLEKPAAAVLLDIETSRPLRLRAAFTLEMKPMWPASFGGQSSDWQERDHALVITEGLRRHAAVVGSPHFARASEQVGHQLPDRTVLLEMDITPEIARRGAIPIVFAGSGAGVESALKMYRGTLAEASSLPNQADAYYEKYLTRTMDVQTPDATLNRAFTWAKLATDQGWQCDDGVGCGLVAGYGLSGASERPGFAWFFGGDALMNSWSIVDYGDFARARGVLEFLRDHQRSDGKIEHELTQSAALLDWSQYPYGYYHADTTALYLFSASVYARHSGDLDFVNRSWPSLDKAYRYCESVLDDDGLLSNVKGGAAAVETGALSGRVAKDVYLAGAWLAALEGFANLAVMAGHPDQADRARAQLEKGRASLNAWFRSGKGFFPFGRLADGSTYDALSGWQAIAVAHGGLDPQKAARAASAFNRPELSADWGVRLFATDSPAYDPLSYNDGSVWPFVTGFTMMAEYKNHRSQAALQHLYGVSALTGFSGPGFIPEYMGGDRAQPLSRAVPHQLFSSTAVIHPLISGLLGLDGDALTSALTVAPHLPANWNEVQFSRYRIGASQVSGTVTRTKGTMRIRLSVQGKPLRTVFSPALPPGSSLISAELNGKAVTARAMASDVDVHAVVDAGSAEQFDLVLRFDDGVELFPDLVAAEPGDRSRAVRLIGTHVEPARLTFELAGPSGMTARVRAWHGDGWLREGVDEVVAFPVSQNDFSHATITYHKP